MLGNTDSMRVRRNRIAPICKTFAVAGRGGRIPFASRLPAPRSLLRQQHQGDFNRKILQLLGDEPGKSRQVAPQTRIRKAVRSRRRVWVEATPIPTSRSQPQDSSNRGKVTCYSGAKGCSTDEGTRSRVPIWEFAGDFPAGSGGYFPSCSSLTRRSSSRTARSWTAREFGLPLPPAVSMAARIASR